MTAAGSVRIRYWRSKAAAPAPPSAPGDSYISFVSGATVGFSARTVKRAAVSFVGTATTSMRAVPAVTASVSYVGKAVSSVAATARRAAKVFWTVAGIAVFTPTLPPAGPYVDVRFGLPVDYDYDTFTGEFYKIPGNTDWYIGQPPVERTLPATHICTTVAQLEAALIASINQDVIIEIPIGTNLAKAGTFIVPAQNLRTGWLIIRGGPASGLRLASEFNNLEAARLHKGTYVSENKYTNWPRIVSTTSGARALEMKLQCSYVWVENVEIFSNNSDTCAYVGPQRPQPQNDIPFLSWVPHHVGFVDCWIHGPFGDLDKNQRGIAYNCDRFFVYGCRINHHKTPTGSGLEAHAVWSPGKCLGRHEFINNVLVASGENWFQGGGSTKVGGVVQNPRDIVVAWNFIYKPLIWKTMGGVNGEIGQWVKNLLESKNASYFLIFGNILEGNWKPLTDQGHDGLAVSLKSTSQLGLEPAVITSNITFKYNWIRKAGAFIAYVATNVTVPLTAVEYSDVLCTEMNTNDYNLSSGYETSIITNRTTDVVIDHVTNIVVNTPSGTCTVGDGRNVTWKNSIIAYGAGSTKGFTASGQTEGVNSINAKWLGTNDIGWLLFYPPVGIPSRYPYPSILGVADVASIGFVNPSTGDYSLLPSSIGYRAGSDGKDLGCDFPRVMAETAGVDASY